MNDLSRTLVVAGHSHAIAVGVPPASIAQPPFVAEVEPSLRAIGGSWPRDDAYWSALVDAAADHIPVVVWDGNQHYGWFLFAIQPPFDFIASSDPDRGFDPAATYVAESSLREFVAPSLAPLEALVERLVAAGDGFAMVAGTPPPKGDEAKVRGLLTSEPHFVHWAAAIGADLATAPLTPPEMLLKIWTLIQKMTRELTERAGGVFVPVPDRLRDDDGFLPTHYWSTDVTHANAAFGREMLREVTAVAASAQHDRKAVA